MAPAEVQVHDQDRIWARLYGDGDSERKQQSISIGAMVSINKSKGVFEKAYMPNWSKEHFTVASALPKRKLNKCMVNKLNDYNIEPVTGSWYYEELQHIYDNQYRIERVLRRRTAADGNKEVFVKWEGWPEKFNFWIRSDQQYNVVR